MAKIRVSRQAQNERVNWRLNSNPLYLERFSYWVERYTQRPPAKTMANKNMVLVLRMMMWRNSADDWARLHATELFLRKRTQTTNTKG